MSSSKRRVGDRLGGPGYAMVLRKIINRPGTTSEIALAAGIGITAAKRIARSLHALGVLHISEYLMFSGRASRPVYAFGDRPDAEPPKRRKSGRASTARKLQPIQPAPELIAFASVLRELREPKSAHELAAATGTARGYLYPLLREMRKLRLIRVAEWDQNPAGGSRIAYYQFAVDRKDAPLPAPRDHVARVRRRREGLAVREEQLQVLRAIAANGFVFSQRA